MEVEWKDGELEWVGRRFDGGVRRMWSYWKKMMYVVWKRKKVWKKISGE